MLGQSFLISLLSALATANFTTTVDIDDFLIRDESPWSEEKYELEGSISKIEGNRTTAVLRIPLGGRFATEYHPNGTESFTFTFGPKLFIGQVAKPDEHPDRTRSLSCGNEEGYIEAFCTRDSWGKGADRVCSSYWSWAHSYFTTRDNCTSYTAHETYAYRNRPVNVVQVVLTAGLENLPATATEATTTATGVARASATPTGPKETGGANPLQRTSIAMALAGSIVAALI